MSQIRTITITGYKRPRYFCRILESLVANDLTGWKIYIQLEPTPMVEEYKKVAAETLSGYDYIVDVNSQKLGVRKNPFQLLEKVFELGSQINIYLEDDVLVGKDTTRLARWYEDNHKPEWLCLSLLGGSALGILSYEDHPDLLFPAKGFNAWGFVVRRDEWYRHFRPNWMIDSSSLCNLSGGIVVGWDWSIHHYLLRTEGLYSLQVAATRTANIGREEGEHTAPDWHDLVCDGLIPTDGPADGAYRLSTLPALPGVVRRHALLCEQAYSGLRMFAEKERYNQMTARLLKVLSLGLVLTGLILIAMSSNGVGAHLNFYAAFGIADSAVVAGIVLYMRRRSKLKWIIRSESQT